MELWVGIMAAIKVGKLEKRVGHRTAGKLAIDGSPSSWRFNISTAAGCAAPEREALVKNDRVYSQRRALAEDEIRCIIGFYRLDLEEQHSIR